MKITYQGKLLKLVEDELLNIFQMVFEKQRYNKVFDIEDYVILGLYDAMISRTDSILTLYASDKIAGCESIARGILEARVFLLYIFDKHTKDRANAYFYSTKYKEIKLGQDILDEGQKGEKIREFLNISLEEFKQEFGEKFSIDKERITEKYNQYVGRNKKTWYQYKDKNKNLRELCESLGIVEEYDVLFKIFSDEAHSKDAARQFNITPVFREQGIGLIEFSSKNIEYVISYCLLNLINMTRKVLHYYNLAVQKRTFIQKVEYIYTSYNIKVPYKSS